MNSTHQDMGPVEYTPENSTFDGIIMRPEVSALERVGNLPLVANTLDFVSSYYASAKKTYPSVTPYLELAERMSSSAASIAMTTTKPVVERLAPTVNSYANRGLDKLEGALPLIRDEPNEIYGSAKAAVTSAVNRRLDSALSTTESYVDYYLPSTEEEEIESEDESVYEGSDDESDASSSLSVDDTNASSSKERLQVISNKVRQRAYQRAMSKVRGVQKRSMETLNQLQFTVDLIRYAKDNMDATRETVTTKVSATNESFKQGVRASQEHVMAAWKSIKNGSSEMIAEVNVLDHARSLAKVLNESCTTLLTAASKIPDSEYWSKKIAWAKDLLETMMQDLSGKTSFSELSQSVIETAQKNIDQAKRLFDALLTLVTENGPIAWLAPDFKSDPLEGLCVQDLEAELCMQDDKHTDNAAALAWQNDNA